MHATDPKFNDCLGVVTVHMPCEFGYLRIARQNVRDFSARCGLSEHKTAQLEMAVDEACTNIIEHSYGRKTGQTRPDPTNPGLHLTLSQYPDRVEILMTDFGMGFDYAQTQSIPPDRYIDRERERGLGLYIIRNFVDVAEYTADVRDGNRLRLVKMI